MTILNRFTCWFLGHDFEWQRQQFVEELKRSVHYYKCTRCGERQYNHGNSYGWWDRWGNWIKGILVLGIIGLMFYGFWYFFSFLPCFRTAEMMELPWKYDIWSGCYYEVQDRWINASFLDIVELLK